MTNRISFTAGYTAGAATGLFAGYIIGEYVMYKRARETEKNRVMRQHR